MKHVLCLLLSIAITLTLSAQPDVLPTDDGDITMTPILHSTMVMQWKGKTIYIDPYGGAERFSEFPIPDFVVITHAHGDHFNKETLGALNLFKAELIAPPSVIEGLENIKFNRITTVANGQSAVRDGISFEAVPMYNLPDDETSRHQKGWGNGYVITIGGKRIYISGDTEDIPEMRNLRDIDYAFVCMNLPYTMTVGQAADAVLEFQPKVVYPFHYRGKDGFSDVNQFKELVGTDPGIEVRLRDWYP